MNIYTRKGDDGSTRLLSGEHVGKSDLRVETYGTLDELQAQLGVCRALARDPQIAQILLDIEKSLVNLAAEIASTPGSSPHSPRIGASDIQNLEAIIDRYTARYALPKGFILPGHSHDSAAMHVARTICRRCERHLVALFHAETGRAEVLAYMNRLSDFLFVLAWVLEASDDHRRQEASPPPKPGVTPSCLHDLAPLLAGAAIRHCRHLAVPMVIAISDTEGELLHFTRMPGALPASRIIAVNKAYTAAALRIPTHELAACCQPGGELYGLQHSLGGRAVLFGGGTPLALDGKVLGAIGISGGTVSQDMEVAQHVLGFWDEIVRIAETICRALPPEAVAALRRHPQILEQVCRQLQAEEESGETKMSAALRLLPLLEKLSA